VALREELTSSEKLEKFETFGRISKEDDGKIIKDENDEVISVELSTYKKLIECQGGKNLMVWLNLAIIIGILCETYMVFYIGQWAIDPELQLEGYNLFAGVIIGLAGFTAVCEFARSKIVCYMIFNAGNKFHADMINKIFRAPINLFFDVTPTGLIINRFSNDLEKVEAAFWCIKWALVCGYNCLMIVVVIAVAKW